MSQTADIPLQIERRQSATGTQAVNSLPTDDLDDLTLCPNHVRRDKFLVRSNMFVHAESKTSERRDAITDNQRILNAGYA